MPDSVVTAMKNSVVEFPDATRGATSLDNFGWSFVMPVPDALLPSVGTQVREERLRTLERDPRNGLIQGAFSAMAAQIASTPWEITGSKRLHIRVGSVRVRAVDYFQDLLRNAHYGKGWDTFTQLYVRSFLRHDRGAFVVISASGNPMRAPTSAITGIEVLDALRCQPTGDPEYPAIYMDTLGKSHLLHHSRVFQAYDYPDPEERLLGIGLSAMSRVVSVANRQGLTIDHVRTNLDDKPSAGILSIAGMLRAEFEREVKRMTADEQVTPAIERHVIQQFLNGLIPLFSADTNNPLRVEVHPFSQAPTNFNLVEYINIDARLVAAATGIDILKFWELTGSNLGSGQQASIISSKAEGNMAGKLLTWLERTINSILPVELEFRFKPQDRTLEQQESAAMSSVVGMIPTLLQIMSPDEVRRLVANKVEAVADVVLDENGELINRDDVDPKPDDGAATLNDVNDTTDTPTNEQGTVDQPTKIKAWDATRSAFIAAFNGITQRVASSAMSASRAEIYLLAEIEKACRNAFSDGLKQGGASGQLDDDEQAIVDAHVIAQIDYIDAFLSKLADGQVSLAQLEYRADMWINKTVQPMLDAGRLASDRNARYQWVYDPTKEHCQTCKLLHGQIHTFKEWHKRDLLPGAHGLDCGGWNCGCKLVKTNSQSVGRFA